MRRWLLTPGSSRHLGRVRMAVVGYCLLWTIIRTSFWLDQATLPDRRQDPVGILSVFDAVIGPGLVWLLVITTLVVGAFAITGRAWRITGPVVALAFLVLTTHGNSWGQVLHTENLAALHLLVLAAGPPGATSLRGNDHHLEDDAGWPLRIMGMVTVCTYMVAGVAKVRFGGLDWISGQTLQNLVAHDNLRKELLGDPSSPLAPLIIEQRWLFGPAALAAVVIELMAPIALVGRRSAAVWSGLAWTFHLANLGVLAVLFLYPLLGLAFLPLLLSPTPVRGQRQTAVRSGRLGEIGLD